MGGEHQAVYGQPVNRSNKQKLPEEPEEVKIAAACGGGGGHVWAQRHLDAVLCFYQVPAKKTVHERKLRSAHGCISSAETEKS